MRSKAQLASFILIAACGGDAGGEDDGSGGGSESSGGSSSTAATTEDGDGDPSEGGTGTAGDDSGGGTTGGGDGDTTPPPLGCSDRELPPRSGATIQVSPGEDGTVVVDGATQTLRSVISGASSGDTIVLADGTYLLPPAGPGEYTGLYFTVPDVTLRSASSNAAEVVIDGGYQSLGDGTAPITIDAAGVVIADVTVRRSVFHLIHIWAGGDGALIHGVHLEDGGQQFLKSSVNEGTVDDVEVSCSRFTMTQQGRDNVWGYGDPDGSTTCYTGGIDTHNARNWSVHDSHFEGIYCDADGVERPAHGLFPEQRGGMTYRGGLAEHGIHMWDSEAGSGHVLERNRIVDCARGIGLGLRDPVHGSAVINNMIVSTHPASREHDVGIIVERAVDTVVAHNSVHYLHPDGYPNAIEYRWAETSGLVVRANLTNRSVRDRDGAVADVSDNVEGAQESWYTDAQVGDLHRVDCATVTPVGRMDVVPDDFDGDAREDPTAPGADGCVSGD